MEKIIYFIDAKTNEYLHSKELDTSKFGLNIPHTTETEPLESKEKFAVCLIDKKWIYQEDNRGKTVYDTSNKEESTIDYLGAIKDGFTLLVPGEFDEWKVDKWVENSEEKELQNTLDIQAQTQEEITSLTKTYPSFEKDTFNTQENEARAWVADNNAETPFLTALSQARGIEKSLMIEKIIANADALKAPIATIIGAYQKAIS